MPTSKAREDYETALDQGSAAGHALGRDLAEHLIPLIDATNNIADTLAQVALSREELLPVLGRIADALDNIQQTLINIGSNRPPY